MSPETNLNFISGNKSNDQNFDFQMVFGITDLETGLYLKEKTLAKIGSLSVFINVYEYNTETNEDVQDVEVELTFHKCKI